MYLNDVSLYHSEVQHVTSLAKCEWVFTVLLRVISLNSAQRVVLCVCVCVCMYIYIYIVYLGVFP